MSMKNFLKRFVAAFGAAAREELAKQPDPYTNLATADPDKLDPTRVNSYGADRTTLPAGGMVGVVSDEE